MGDLYLTYPRDNATLATKQANDTLTPANGVLKK